MLIKKQMQEILDFKLRGFSINEIIHYFEELGKKAPSLPMSFAQVQPLYLCLCTGSQI